MDKPKGRPRREIPEPIRTALATATADEPAHVDTTDADPDEVRELKAAITAGARHLNGKPRFRKVGKILYFWAESA